MRENEREREGERERRRKREREANTLNLKFGFGITNYYKIKNAIIISSESRKDKFCYDRILRNEKSGDSAVIIFVLTYTGDIR